MLRAFLIFMCISTSSYGQESRPVSLIADVISVDPLTGGLVASGDVRILYGDSVVSTQQLSYNPTTGLVDVPSPLTIQDRDGTQTLFADFAQLDTQLQTGVIAGARSLIDNQFQIAAGSAQLIDGRYTVLNNIVASSCSVCDENPVPIWQIRADQIVRDAELRQLEYRNAVLEIFGVPVIYLPYFSHPDPAVERTTGLLYPSASNLDSLGFALKLPYFIVIDDSRDVTLTPIISTQEGLLLEGQYRQVFNAGKLQFDGAVLPSVDTSRGYGQFTGYYDLGSGITARFDAIAITDKAFLSDFGYSYADRLTSSFTLDKFERDRFWRISTQYTRSLRDNEPQGTVPFVLPQFEYRQSYDLGDGRLYGTATGLSFTRETGRDVTRVTGGGGWEESYITEPGIVVRGFADAFSDLYFTQDDPVTGNNSELRLRAQTGLDLRWPFVSRTQNGTHLIEPIVQMIIASETGSIDNIANEDSLLVELDETNIFDTNRFPGADRFETGTYVNAGLRYQGDLNNGITLSGTLGRIYRDDVLDDFPLGSGLEAAKSDYAFGFALANGAEWTLSGKLLIDDDLEVRRTQLRAGYNFGKISVAGTYVNLARDAVNTEDRTEIVLDLGYRFDDNWSTSLGTRLDLETNNFITNDASISWGTECATFSFSVSRRYQQSNNISPTTEFGLNLELIGLGFSPAAGRSRQICTN